MKNNSKKWGRVLKNMIVTPLGIKRLDKLIPNYFRFFGDWRKFNRLSVNNKPFLRDIYPQLWDRTSTTPFDAHYLYQAIWATEKIYSIKSKFHLDIGSQIQFATNISIFQPILYLDFRPVFVEAPGFTSVGGDIKSLPFKSSSFPSISCLHVIEHIGLGRYGDKVDPDAHLKGIEEIYRVLEPGGDLLITTPVGIERICFNAHRIFNPKQFVTQFPQYSLVEFSYVDDYGKMNIKADLDEGSSCEYGCGLFWLRKSSN